ncbi:MAG: carboxypeptidase-like regulatory domain-containing protein [Acidobacteriota bacterium]|nr:carboxypeptidase-like regulatory domain-containing protein [Acidobacteriota bacterium]
MTTSEGAGILARGLLVIMLCSLAQAQQPSSREDKSEETTTGAITGRVVNENGQPLANASVVVRTLGFQGQGQSTTTDGEGNFQLRGLDATAYLVFAAAPAYITMPRDPDSSQSAYSRVGESVRLELIKGGVITGLVSTSADEPVVSVRVRAYMVRDSNGQPPRVGIPFREQTTDDRGVYRIYGLAPGTYIVSAGGGSGNFSGFDMNAYDADAPTYAPSSPRETAAEVNVRAGEETGSVDIRYRGDPGHLVSGTARDAAASADSSFFIRLTPVSNIGAQMSISSFQPPGGRGFTFFGVADGDYDLTAQTFFPGGEINLSESRRIKVKGADLTGIELFTKPLGTVLGRVALVESKTPECKGKRRPLFAETVVSAWHNEKDRTKDQPQFVWGYGAPTLPDKQGNFTLRNLAPAQYRFSTRSFAKYWYLQSIALQPTVSPAAAAATASRAVDAARNWTLVKPGERVSGLILTLAEGAASFHGQIKLVEGQKLPSRLFVYLVPAEREKAEDVLRFFASQVAADGAFAINNLAPGRYWVIVKVVRENESSVLTKLRLPDESEARANLRREAEAAKTEIELKPCQNTLGSKLPLN